MAAALLVGEDGGEEWRQLVVDLLEFHRRESKPAWWAVFSRQDLPYAELLEDAECLAGLEATRTYRPVRTSDPPSTPSASPCRTSSSRWGTRPKRAGTLEPAGEVVAIDEDALTIELKLGPTRSRIEDGTCLIPSGPVGDKVLRAAVYRFAEAVRDGEAARYSAIVSILRRDLPDIAGHEPGAPVVPDGAEPLPATISALLALDGSHLLIQGPPGAGKTYTSSQAIVACSPRAPPRQRAVGASASARGPWNAPTETYM